MDPNVGWVLLAHIGLPLIFGLAFVGFSVASITGPLTWAIAIETALDLAILSIGATGAIFENPKLISAFGPENTLVGIGVIGINLLISSILLWLRRFAHDNGRKPGSSIGFFALFLGALTIVVVASVVSWGYRSAPPMTPQNGKISKVEVPYGLH